MSNTNVKYINETWLSNQLAWLLDPKGSHGLGSEFAKEFVSKYLKQTSLKDKPFDKNIKLEDFEVCREFYIQTIEEGARRIDIVYMDIVQKTVIVIENKYNGKNSLHQLSEYMQIQNIFPDCDIYFIYISKERKDINQNNIDKKNKELVLNKYNFISWDVDIPLILKDFTLDNYAIYKLYSLLLLNKDSDSNIELDFTDEEIQEISTKILNLIDETCLNNPTTWENNKSQDNKNVISIDRKKTNQKVYTYIKDKNIEIRFGDSKHNNNKVFNIQNNLSNKQIIYYMIYVLEQATKSEKAGAYKNSKAKLDKDKVYRGLVSSNSNINVKIKGEK